MFEPQIILHKDISVENGALVWADGVVEIQKTGSWRWDAVKMEVYNINDPSLIALGDHIFNDIVSAGHLALPKTKKPAEKRKDTLRIFLANLWIAYVEGKALFYSRDSNFYSQKNNRGKKIYLSYDVVKDVADAINEGGYTEQKIGRQFYENDTIGTRTRMWAAPKLIGLFMNYGLCRQLPLIKPESDDLVVLNKTIKKPKIDKKTGKVITEEKTIRVFFKPNTKTRAIEHDLQRYNEAVRKHCVTVNLNSEVEISNDFLLEELYPNIVNRQSEILVVKFNNKHQTLYPIKQPDRNLIQWYLQKPSDMPTNDIKLRENITKDIKENTKDKTNDFNLFNTITHRISHKASVHMAYSESNFHTIWLFREYLSDLKRTIPKRKKARKKFLAEKKTLADIGVEKLIFTLENETLHRVFNRENKKFPYNGKKFQYNGRAYGAQHQTLPKNMRPFIHIDTEEVSEVDYSCLHTRMLYHQKDEDFRGDVYDIDGDGRLRVAYKTISLVAINAADKAEAISAARKKLAQILEEDKSREPEKKKLPEDFDLNTVGELLDNFMEAHPLIKNKICSDVGIRLMYEDAIIMNNILMKLLDNGVIGLPVYDSVIVQKRHKDLLWKIMEDEYEKLMGFKPVLDLK